MNLNENLDFLDVITIIAFLMAIQNNEEMGELIDCVKSNKRCLEEILKKQEEIFDELERKGNA